MSGLSRNRRPTRDLVTIARAVLESGASVRLRTDGESMRPAIESGDAIVVAPCPDHFIVKGTIVLTWAENRLLAHRITDVKLESGRCLVTTRGDGRTEDDPLITSTEIVGRVVRIDRMPPWQRLHMKFSAFGRRLSNQVPAFNFSLYG